MANKKASGWLPLFEDFISELRINSKEVSNPDGNGAKLDLWLSQKRFMEEVAAGLDQGVRTFYCLKSRQLGITTISLAIDIFWLAMHPGLVGALVTENEKNRDKNRATLKQYMESFPEDYFGSNFSIVKNNRTSMTFSNGSRFDFLVAGTKQKATSWGEGEGYAFVHATEVAAYGSEEGLASFEEAFAQSNPQRLFIFESTAKGANLWKDRWEGGFKDPHSKRSFFIGWWASATNRLERSDPRFAQYGLEKPDAEEREKIALVKREYNYEILPEQLAWYRWRTATADLSTGMLDQNQPWSSHDAFVMTGHSFFPTRQVSKHLDWIDKNPDQNMVLGYNYTYGDNFFQMQLHPLEDDDDDEPELKIWEEPVINGKYVIGCDPAYGRNDHKDSICIQVYRCYADKLLQVAEYASHETEVRYAAWVLAHLAGAYGDCIVNLELGGGGRIIMNEWDNIKLMLNSEMYAQYTKSGNWEDALDQARWYLYTRPDTMGAGFAYNFEVSWRTKQELMHGLKGAYITNELIIRSRKLLREMLNVVQDGSTIGAPESNNPDMKDDRVFATSFAHRAWVNWRKPELIQMGYSLEEAGRVERGETTPQIQALNRSVHRFYANLMNRQSDIQPTWRSERGLS